MERFFKRKKNYDFFLDVKPAKWNVLDINHPDFCFLCSILYPHGYSLYCYKPSYFFGMKDIQIKKQIFYFLYLNVLTIQDLQNFFQTSEFQTFEEFVENFMNSESYRNTKKMLWYNFLWNILQKALQKTGHLRRIFPGVVRYKEEFRNVQYEPCDLTLGGSTRNVIQFRFRSRALCDDFLFRHSKDKEEATIFSSYYYFENLKMLPLAEGDSIAYEGVTDEQMNMLVDTILRQEDSTDDIVFDGEREIIPFFYNRFFYNLSSTAIRLEVQEMEWVKNPFYEKRDFVPYGKLLQSDTFRVNDASVNSNRSLMIRQLKDRRVYNQGSFGNLEYNTSKFPLKGNSIIFRYAKADKNNRRHTYNHFEIEFILDGVYDKRVFLKSFDDWTESDYINPRFWFNSLEGYRDVEYMHKIFYSIGKHLNAYFALYENDIGQTYATKDKEKELKSWWKDFVQILLEDHEYLMIDFSELLITHDSI